MHEGTKYDDGKPRTDLLDPTSLLALAKVLTYGAKKYEAHNWRRGMAWSRLQAALLRHVLAFESGQDLDDETGLPHMAHAMCCAMFLLNYQLTGSGTDDRYKGEAKSAAVTLSRVQLAAMEHAEVARALGVDTTAEGRATYYPPPCSGCTTDGAECSGCEAIANGTDLEGAP